MRALVIGRGSMGRRRIRDLTALGVEVESWDITDGMRRPNRQDPDIIVISTPPETKYVHATAAWGRPVFLEADVEVVPSPHFPSATPLFTEWWPRLRDGPAARATEYWQWTGQHIADWHPGATAETYYALRDPELAIREMVAFELIWLTKLYGPVADAEPYVKRDREWYICLRHQSGVRGWLDIDIESSPAVRRFHFGISDSVNLRYSEADYLAEMRALIAAVKGEQPWPYTQEEERENLEVLRTIERGG